MRLSLFALVVSGAFADEAYFAGLASSVRAASFPELADAHIELRPFRSPSVYFQARFTWTSFLFHRRLAYVIGFNEDALRRGAAPEALRAVMAHELSHLSYYRQRNRLRLLGLVRLVSPRATARLERETDKDTIRRGYGPGLRLYRQWLYANIPPREVPRKQRTYLTPEEIEREMH